MRVCIAEIGFGALIELVKGAKLVEAGSECPPILHDELQLLNSSLVNFKLRESRRQLSYEVVEKRNVYVHNTPPIGFRVFDLNVRAKSLPTGTVYSTLSCILVVVHIDPYTSLTNW